MPGWKPIACLVVMFCVVLGAPAAARAQTNQRAWVTTTDGREQQGRLTSFSSSGVLLKLPDGTVARLPLTDVLRVEIGDGLGDGARNGAIAGAIVGLLPVIAFAADCDYGCNTGAFVVTAEVLYAAMGAGIGVAIDALRHGRETIYSSSVPRPVAFAPVVTPKRVGMQVAIRW